MRKSVLLFDQQPLVGFLVVRARRLAAPGGDQREAPVQLEAIQLEVELAELEPSLGRGLQITNSTYVPGDHRACSVVSLWNDLFELQVFERMVLGQHRQLLVTRLQTRTARNGEAFQRSTDLQPDVVVRAGRVVQVHDE